MYISIGFLWLIFKITQGEIIQCPIGGLTNTEQCEKLTKESVFQRFFIDKGNTSMHKTFENSLILDENIPIKNRWKEALKIGTDTYRIKFHTKLVNQYKHIYNSLANEECMVLIQSFYVAASTYYFSMNCKLAYKVINDGLEFFEIVTGQLYFGNNDEIQNNQEKHARVWYILLQILKVDILNCLDKYHEEKSEIVKKISEEEKQFDCPNYGSFPSSAVLLFREYFLNKDIDDNTKTKLENWLNNRTLWENFNDDILYRDYISLYKFLVFFYNSPKDMDKIINIYKAIERPVLSTEDRLLNYKATELALDIYSLCFDGDKSPICIAFLNLKDIDLRLESKITPKLHIFYDLKTKELKNELKIKLKTSHRIIEENVLHLIVTAALDIDSEKYQKNIENVNYAIESLNKYEIYLTNTSTKDLTEEQKNKNLFIVYKWLMEMNGILKNNLQATLYQDNFEKALKQATNLSKKTLNSSYSFGSDDHFKFLIAKQQNKILLHPYDWEVSTRPGGWIPSKRENLLKLQNICFFGNIKCEMFMQLSSIQSFEYVNRIELQILSFRHITFSKDCDQMYYYIMKAITEIVITPEDRLKNLEAHELLTVFLMDRNKLAIDSMKKYKNNISALYKDFLMDPELRDKKSLEIKSLEEQQTDIYWENLHNRNKSDKIKI